jgi:hypothetical protein
MKHGGYIGTLRDSNHKPIKIDGLWGLAFGDGAAHQPVNTLFFAAGPNDEGATGPVWPHRRAARQCITERVSLALRLPALA